MNYFGLFLAYFSLFVFGLADNIRGPIFPEILAEYSLSNKVGSLYFAVASFMGIVGGLLGSFWLKNWSMRSSLQGSLLGVSFAFFMMSVAPSFLGLLLAAAIFGVSLGVLGVSQNVLALSSSDPARRQKVQAGLHSMYGAASLLAPICFQIGMDQFQSWRFGVALCSGLVFLSFLSTLWPKELPLAQLSSDSENSHQGNRKKEIYFASILATYVLCELLISSRLALYLRNEVGLETSQSSWAVTLFFVFMFVGRLLYVAFHPPFLIRNQLLLSLTLTVVSILFGIYFHWSGLVLSGLLMAPFYPLAMTAVGQLFPSTVSRATSFCIAAIGVFVVFMHIVFGFTADFLGLKSALLIAPLFAFISLLGILNFQRFFAQRLP